jgi:hypothetical protein
MSFTDRSQRILNETRRSNGISEMLWEDRRTRGFSSPVLPPL